MNLSISKRITISAAYFVAVNGLCGLIAFELRYPSLWGKVSVFPEYAYPLPLSWALMHWLSMGPLTVLVFKMWNWEPALLQRLRISLVCIAVFCIVADVVSGGASIASLSCSFRSWTQAPHCL